MPTAASQAPYLFGDLLALARISWVEQMQARLDQAGHPGYRRSDAAVLRLLDRGPLSIGGLGQLIGISRQAARKLAESLRKRGYASIARDPDDARRLTVMLTPAGARYAAAVTSTIHALNRELTARVTPDQLAAADSVLRASLASADRGRADALVGRPGAQVAMTTTRP